MSGGRRSALVLVMVILLVELVLSGKGQEIWGAMWSGPFPLGQGISPQASAAGQGNVSGIASALLSKLGAGGQSKGSAGGEARTNTTGG